MFIYKFINMSENLFEQFQQFQHHAELIKSSDKKFDNDTLLSLYGYYKQALLGDCDVEEPGFWEIKEKAKWTAWDNHKGMSKEHAMKRYIKKVKKLLEDEE